MPHKHSVKKSIHKNIDTLAMSTNKDSALHTLVGKHVLIRNHGMVPRIIRGYSGVVTDVYLNDDQAPFYRVKLDVVQANGDMTDIVQRLNEKCNGQNGKYLVHKAHVVQDPTPNDMYWRHQYMPPRMTVCSDAEIRASLTDLVEPGTSK
jgi:hypothetical protein